jgi:hypothetical protein
MPMRLWISARLSKETPLKNFSKIPGTTGPNCFSARFYIKYNPLFILVMVLLSKYSIPTVTGTAFVQVGNDTVLEFFPAKKT